jgi:predicted deacylase
MATAKIATRKDPLDVPDLTRRAIDLDVILLGDGSVLRVPINIVAGKGHHPCLVAVAGIHGDEYDGIHALLELWDELEATDLVGRLVMVPSANPPAFAGSRRCSPLDNLDLNRIFPGKVSGLPSEQTAHFLFESVVKRANFVFSMHGWTAYGSVVPYVEFNHIEASTARASFDAAAAAGFKIIRISNWPPGLMTRVANEAGIPGIEAEIGGKGITTAENRALYKCYLRRLMAHLGMLRTPADRGVPPPEPPRIVEHFDITSPIGGVVSLETHIDTEVRGGQRLATIKDFHCRVLHEVIAPAPGLVGMARVCGSVQPGELMFRIFRDVTNPLG